MIFYPAESWNIDLVPGSISCLRLFRICYRFGRFFYRFMIHRNRRGILLCTIRFLCWICQDLLAWRFWFGWFRLDTLRCLISLWRPTVHRLSVCFLIFSDSLMNHKALFFSGHYFTFLFLLFKISRIYNQFCFRFPCSWQNIFT